MDPEVARHRTFADALATYQERGVTYDRLPVWISPQQIAGQKDVYVAYTIRDKHLVQILIREKKDQNFWGYATAWEFEWSKLVFASNSVTPLVDEKMTVVGYYDWISEGNIFVPGNVPTKSKLELPELLEKGYDVFVAKRSPGPSYRALGVTERSQLLLMGIHGNVLLSNGLRFQGYVQSESITPYDLWIGIKLVVSLAGSLRGKIVATLASKTGRSVGLGLFRELTEEELAAVRGGSRSGSPGRTLVVGRGANTGRSTVPDIGSPETLANKSAIPDYPTLLQNAPQKFPQLKGQFEDIFIERIGINPNPPFPEATGLTPAGVKAARDLLRPGGTLRLLQNSVGGETLDEIEKNIRSMLSEDFTITKVERHPDGLLVTTKKK
jgi:hypothetical protein